jgi:hypothetical protein
MTHLGRHVRLYVRDGTPDDEVTSEEELPVATGGITAPAPEILGNEDDVDGCELDFTAAELTNDEELPVHGRLP